MTYYRSPRYKISPDWRTDHYKDPKRTNKAIHKDRYSAKNNYSILSPVFIFPVIVFGLFFLCLFLGIHF